MDSGFGQNQKQSQFITCRMIFPMRRTSQKLLVKTAAEYLASKSRREIQRFTGKRGAPAQRRTGRRLRAVNFWQEWELGKFQLHRRQWLRAVNFWQEWELALLAKIPDKEVARRTGRTLLAVVSKRIDRGLRYYQRKNFSPVKKWTKEEVTLLGTAVDSAIARKLNRTTESAKCQREARDIPSFQKQHYWTKAENKIVMGYSYKEAARRLRLPQSKIEFRRRTLRAGNVGAPIRKWSPEEVALLGKYTDTELARKLKRSRGSVAWKRWVLHIQSKGDYSRPWTPAEDRLLGTMPDAQLAPLLKRGIVSVEKRRLKLRILFQATPVSVLPRRAWTAKEEQLLGTLSDAEVARRLKRTTVSVFHRRNRLGIHCFVQG
jgi:hypothetical protein